MTKRRGERAKGERAMRRKRGIARILVSCESGVVIFDFKPDASTALSMIKPVTLSEVEVLKPATQKL